MEEKNFKEHIECKLSVCKTLKNRLIDIRNTKTASIELGTKNGKKLILLNEQLRKDILNTLELYYVTKFTENLNELDKVVKDGASNELYLTDEQNKDYDFIKNMEF